MTNDLSLLAINFLWYETETESGILRCQQTSTCTHVAHSFHCLLHYIRLRFIFITLAWHLQAWRRQVLWQSFSRYKILKNLIIGSEPWLFSHTDRFSALYLGKAWIASSWSCAIHVGLLFCRYWIGTTNQYLYTPVLNLFASHETLCTY